MRRLVSLSLLALALGGFLSPLRAADDKIKVLIIDGQNNHDWKATTPVLKKELESCGRFTVDVATTPQRPPLPPEPNDGSEAAITKYKEGLNKYADAYAAYKNEKFAPDLTKYQVVLSNYNGAAWPAEVQKSLEENLKSGRIGLVIVHAANNSFTELGRVQQDDRHGLAGQ